VCETIKVEGTWYIDVVIPNDRRSPYSQTETFIKRVHLPEQDIFELSQLWRVRPNALDAVEPSCLTELGGC
jgi:hypothetical protein